MYKSPSIVATGRSSLFTPGKGSKIFEESKNENGNSQNKEEKAKISEKESVGSIENQEKRNDEIPDIKGVHRTSIGSVGDIAQKFGGQSRASIGRRKSDLNYKLE